jgi:peptide/nickel transport system permease protein
MSFAAVRRPSLVIGGALTAALVMLALLSLAWTPYDPAEMRILARLQGPSATHWLGTDQYGRDVAAMLMVGARNSFLVGFAAVGLGALAGIVLGAVAAARVGSLLDEALMRTADFTFAFPAVLSAVMIATVAGPGIANAVIAIAIFNVPVFARLTRGAALQIWARDFVRAARALGRTPLAITVVHVAPNIAGLIVVQATIQFALAILAEAGLSYLGLGVQPPAPSWGRMLNEAQTYFERQPLLAVFPGAAIALAVLGFNLLGDGLRDLIDPKLTRARR